MTAITKITRPAALAAVLAGGLLLGSVGCDALGFGGGKDDRGGTVSPNGMVGRTVAKGDGIESYTADADGTVRLYNTKSGTLVYTGELRRRQRFEVDPDKDLAMIDGNTVYSQNLERNDEHAITFVSASDPTNTGPNRNPSGVPTSAQRVGGVSSSAPYTYSAPSDGRIYLYDTNSRRLLTSLNAQQGELFTVDLGKSSNRVSLAGRAVSTDVSPRGTYAVYFEPRS